jgi:plasmid maintenance system killer protein
MQTQQITEYALYQGKTKDKIQLFIKVKKLSVAEAEERLEILSSILAEKLDKVWKCLPSVTLPEAYHIVTLPYKQL